jgi:hypothetical protein
MRFFCTYFDAGYLPRGIALYRSLVRHVPAFRLYVLCLDDVTYDALMRAALPSVAPLRLIDLEAFDPELVAARGRRSLVEYYFTLTSVLPGYLLQIDREIDIVTYLDSDLLFFADPEPLFEELGGGAVGITPHRFAETGLFRNRYGLYNVGWLSWRRDQRASNCMAWYRRKSIEWCYDQVEDDRYADQKYLDQFTARFPGVRALQHKGANLAPWNNERFQLAFRDDAFYVDGQPLIFYHFHGLKSLYELDPEKTSVKQYLTGPLNFDFDLLMERVYVPYVEAMKEARREVEGFQPAAASALQELRHVDAPPSAAASPPWRMQIDWAVTENFELSGGPDPTPFWPEDQQRAFGARSCDPRPIGVASNRAMAAQLCELAVCWAAAELGRAPRVADFGDPDGMLDRLIEVRPRVLSAGWTVIASAGLEQAIACRMPEVSFCRTVPEALDERQDVVFAGLAAVREPDWATWLSRAARAVRWLILEMLTVSGTPTTAASFREPGRSVRAHLWIVNRDDLAFALDQAGLALRRETVWLEPFVKLPDIPEPADRRTFLLESLVVERRP